MLDLELVRTFVAVVESGGFSRAARRVHRAQPTISQQIRRLEQDLGRPLLVRGRTNEVVTPTEAGEVLLSHARRLLAIAADAREALIAADNTPIVRLGVPEDFAGRRLTDLLSAFGTSVSQVRLDTVSGWSAALRKQLDCGEIDLALVKRDKGAGPCLAHWPEALVWAAGLRSDFKTDPIPLALFPHGCIYRNRAVEILEARGRRWRVAYTSQGLMGVQAAVASGLGISILPLDTFTPEHRRLSDDDGFPDPPPSEVALIAKSGRPSRSERIVSDFLLSHLPAMLGAPCSL